MATFNDKRIIACPECKCILFSVDLQRHFLKRHKKELSANELVEMLFGSKQAAPVSSGDAAAFLARLEKKEERRPKKECTPRSMLQWGVNKRSGPLGPGKG